MKRAHFARVNCQIVKMLRFFPMSRSGFSPVENIRGNFVEKRGLWDAYKGQKTRPRSKLLFCKYRRAYQCGDRNGQDHADAAGYAADYFRGEVGGAEELVFGQPYGIEI